MSTLSKGTQLMSHKYCTSIVLHYCTGITCHQLCSICRHIFAQSLQKVLPSCPLYTYLYMYSVAVLLATSLSQQQHLHCFAEQSMPCQSFEEHWRHIVNQKCSSGKCPLQSTACTTLHMFMWNDYTLDHVNEGGASLLALTGYQKRVSCFQPAACHNVCTRRDA